MNRMKTYLVHAFVGKDLAGSPACVILLYEWLSDTELKEISAKNAVPETVFVLLKENNFEIRWFTPEIEMDLCGHATLAAAHVLFEEKIAKSDSFIFSSQSGDLEIEKREGIIFMAFPIRTPIQTSCPQIILDSLSIKPKEILKSRDYILVYDSEDEISNLQVDSEKLNTINIDPGGICVTAKGEACDFVSRFFTPQASIFEDPVTGSAHCSLVPYWSRRLGNHKLHAKQRSKEGGELFCEQTENHIIIGGRAQIIIQS